MPKARAKSKPSAAPAGERRATPDRRADSDRREFPPRPEGRRRASGRRAGDPAVD